MTRSKREIPHYYLSLTVDMGPAMSWMADHNAGLPVASRMVPAAMLAAATARAAVSGSPVNGHMVDGSFQAADTVQLGMAVSLRGGGLVAPVISDAHRLDAPAMMTQLRDLVSRARSGRLTSAQMGDPTITITNLGDRGTDAVFGVIYPPQVAMVGFGVVAQRPWVVDGVVAPAWLVTVTLAADHRASDGRDGATFLGELGRLLADPDQLATIPAVSASGPAGGSDIASRSGVAAGSDSATGSGSTTGSGITTGSGSDAKEGRHGS
jgi:pyruvate dehydrogenase E2 component (dihydrolipoamide acetyltransferase)